MLTHGVTENRPWAMPAGSPVRIYVDAASTPAHCAAVLVHAGTQGASLSFSPCLLSLFAGRVHYTNGDPALCWLSKLSSRNDNQIMSLAGSAAACLSMPCARTCQELLAIVLGLASFLPEVKGERVVVYSDNKGCPACAKLRLLADLCSAGAELSTARGSSKADDHNRIVHDIWTFAWQHRVQLWLERVPSAQNISDSPSRGDHQLLSELGAQWRRPAWDLQL